ncbi:hypothetical protein ACO1D1_22510 [Neobacillus sp. 19]
MLHFRHFLIPTLMVGAALFLPVNAFAEKSEQNGQANSQKEIVQTIHPTEKTENAAKQANGPAKAKNANSIEKTVTLPEPAAKNQSAVKQPSANRALKQAASQKPAVAQPKTLPDQANGNGYGLSAVKKTENAIKDPGQPKPAAKQENETGLGNKQPAAQDEAELYPEITVKDQGSQTKLVPRIEPKKVDSNVSDKKTIEPQLPEPVQKGKPPVSKEEIPNADRAVNPTQRSNQTGGQSNDRISSGLSTISFLDKWFEWNKYYEIQLVQPYLSRYTLMNNQWVNAPPSPPPEEAPFFKTVYRS